MAIWTSQHQHQHRHCKKFIFAFRNCFEKIEYLCIFWFLVMTSVPLCCKYLFLYDLYSICTIQPQASIGVIEKGCLSFQKHPSIGIVIKQLLRKFLHTSQQNIQGGVLFKYACRPSWDFPKKLFRAAILWRTCYHLLL